MAYDICDLCNVEFDLVHDGLVTDACGTVVCELCCEAHVLFDHRFDGECFTSIDEDSL